MDHNLETLLFEVREEDVGKRIDQFLSEVYPEFSRSYFQKLIKEGFILLNGKKKIKPSYKVKEKEIVTVTIPPDEDFEIIPEKLDLDIYYEDKDVAVVNKPAGMVVHPSPGHTKGTLVNGLLYHFKEISNFGGRERAGIVHRLDKDTSGLMVIAKSEFAHKELQKQFQERTVDKKYFAITTGIIKKDRDLIDLPIGRSIYNRKKMGTVGTNLRDALTEYMVLHRFEKENLTAVDLKIYTGRTHQIRVHMSSIGHPLYNDATYGFKSSSIKSVKLKEFSKKYSYQILVAYRLRFLHPRKNNEIDIKLKKFPDHVDEILKILGFNSGEEILCKL